MEDIKEVALRVAQEVNYLRRGLIDYTVAEEFASRLIAELQKDAERQEPAGYRRKNGRKYEYLRGRPNADTLATGWEPFWTRPRLKAATVPEGWKQGVEAVAKMLEKKADDYAIEHGYSDMGSVSFGRGLKAELMQDYHSGLLELAEEVRAMLEASPSLPAQSEGEQK